MEPTGRAVRVVTLAGLFRKVVDCFEYTRIGRDVSKSGRAHSNWIELDSTRARLSRWGEIVGLNGEVENVQFLEPMTDNVPSVERLLAQIGELFADFEGVSGKSNGVEVAGDSSLMVSNAQPDLDANLYEKMRNLSVKRQHGTALKQKTKWALYEKKHFEKLVEGVTELVNALMEKLPDVSTAEIEANKALLILEDGAISQDHTLQAAIPVVSGSKDSDAANPTTDATTIELNYPKLDSAKGEFRMLTLEASTDVSADIKCHVHNRSQYRNPKFEALSYRWGDPKNNTPIYIRLTAYQGEEPSDKTPYLPWPVTRNLEQALRALRLPDRDRLLWVDQLCINQMDLAERAEQVQIMAQIYQVCTRGVLWLGPEDARISRAMKLIPRIQGHDESGHDKTCNHKAVAATEMTTFSAFSGQDWEDLKNLILHPEVWDRVWIIQELILSPKFVLVCGNATLDWECIDSVLDNNREVLAQFDSPGPVSTMIQQAIVKVTTIRTYRMPPEITSRIFNKSLLSTFFWFLEWKATDPRDKVHAVLSIVTDDQKIAVDYERTMDQLSVEFAKICLAQGNVRLLSHCTSYCANRTLYLKKHPASSSPGKSADTTEVLLPRRIDWPTWIPDLSDKIIETAKVSGLSIAGMSNFKACGSMEGMESMQVSNCKVTDSLELLMFGVFIDSVKLINPATFVSSNETPRDRWIRDVLAWAPPEAKQPNALSHPYPWSDTKNESYLTAYWRTIVTDRRVDKRLTADDLRQSSWYTEISEGGSEIPEEHLILAGWRFGKTSAGLYCMFPPQAKEGDVICVPTGGQVPLLLRPQGGKRDGDDDARYELIGEAYVHGVMDGMGILRGLANMHKMMQADPNHDFNHMHRKLENETVGTQFFMKMFVVV